MIDPTVPPVDEADLRRAVSWAREAGELTLGYFRNTDLAVDHKSDGSPVTVADREAELLLRRRIGEQHPADSIIGEEHDNVVGNSARTWVIDPIDGTKAFSCGVGTYSNLLYLEDEHGPAVGVINLPALGETVWAGRGRGCHLNDQVARVAAPSDSLDGQILSMSSMSYLSGEMLDAAHALGVEMRTWGDAYGYALVATGRIGAMFDPAMAWWDLAAVSVVMTESGGTITRHDGSADIATPTLSEPYPYSAIASGSGPHDAWVQLLKHS